MDQAKKQYNASRLFYDGFVVTLPAVTSALIAAISDPRDRRPSWLLLLGFAAMLFVFNTVIVWLLATSYQYVTGHKCSQRCMFYGITVLEAYFIMGISVDRFSVAYMP